MLDLLDAGLPPGATGVFSTRSGGTSAGPYRGLNLSQRVGDDPGAVVANRELVAGELAVPLGLVFAEQVHGAGVQVVSSPASGQWAAGIPGVDGLVTRERGVGLVALGADCLPVLLVDPVAGVAGAAHAGRPGLVAGVLQAVVEAMVALGAQAGRTVATIGPGICGGCYEVPVHMADEVGSGVPGSRATTRRGSPSVDLVAGARGLLEGAGVGRVLSVGGCTLEQPERWYSYRRDRTTGRHAGVVLLT